MERPGLSWLRPRPGSARGPGTRGARLGLLAAGLLASGILACGLTDEAPLPPDVQDPKTAQTPAGAVERYRATLNLLAPMFDSLLTMTGVLTDELASLPAPLNAVRSSYAALDSRHNLTAFGSVYAALHRVRGEAQEARGFLQAFAPDSSPALVGHLYAVEGYAELFLADLFCSGIPLSRVDFGADYTLAAGSRTDDVYWHAVRLFDSALALAGDSARIHTLAAIGRGRGLLALGQFADAAEAVAAVPDGYAYQVVYPSLVSGDAPRVFDGFAGCGAARDMGPSWASPVWRTARAATASTTSRATTRGRRPRRSRARIRAATRCIPRANIRSRPMAARWC